MHLFQLKFIAVLIGFIGIGWLFKGYQAPLYVWCGSLLVFCYLVKVGSGAISLSSFWVIAIMAAAVIKPLWLYGLPIPLKSHQYVYSALGISWLLCLGTVCSLGKAVDSLKKMFPQKNWPIILITMFCAACFATGRALYTDTSFFLYKILKCIPRD